MYPTISDGLVLTGFSLNSSFVGYFGAGADFVQANLNQPFRLGNLSSSTVESFLNTYGLTDYVAGISPSPGLAYPNGYLTNTNINANQYLFALPGYFDTGLLEVGEATKQPVTVGELLTVTGGPTTNVYAGPVLIITGCQSPSPFSPALSGAHANPLVANDLPFCGGDCLATGIPSLPSIPAAAVSSFPNVGAGNFSAYIQPNTGHGINIHYNSTGAYDVIHSFLQSKGL